MSRLNSFIKEKHIQKVFFDDLRLVKKFLDMCEKTNDVMWRSGDRPLHEWDRIEYAWEQTILYDPSSMVYCEFLTDMWNDGTIRLIYCVDLYPSKTYYNEVLSNTRYIDFKDLLLQLGSALIILNKEDKK